MLSTKFSRKAIRQEQALERQEKSDKKTAEQRLAQLDKLFGKGQGAQRERARLEKEVRLENRKLNKMANNRQ